MDNQDKNVQTDPFKQDFNPSEMDKQFSPPESGPQFGMDDQERGGFRGWLSKYGSSVILPIIALLILAGGIYLYASQRSDEVALETETDQEATQEELGLGLDQEPLTDEEIAAIIGQADQAADDQSMQPQEIITQPEPEVITPEPIVSGESYTIKASQGDGITHLARKVAADYLSENPNSEITNEHRIYIEDYLKDRAGSRLLEVGEEVTFDKDMVRQAVDQSLTLTDAQLKNLEKYSAQVAF